MGRSAMPERGDDATIGTLRAPLFHPRRPSWQIGRNGRARRRRAIMEIVMDAEKNATIDPEVWEQARREASIVGISPDELASEALRREIARRSLARIRREGEANRRGMTDDQVDETVNTAVQDWRREQRGR